MQQRMAGTSKFFCSNYVFIFKEFCLYHDRSYIFIRRILFCVFTEGHFFSILDFDNIISFLINKERCLVIVEFSYLTETLFQKNFLLQTRAIALSRYDFLCYCKKQTTLVCHSTNELNSQYTIQLASRVTLK